MAAPRPEDPFSGAGPGTTFGPLAVTISPAANARSWGSAGVDHPALRAGACYPPFAANLTILAVQTRVPGVLLHTRQHLRCHRIVAAGTPLVVHGRVLERFARRGREHLAVRAVIAGARSGLPVWTSDATFCAP